MSCGFLVLIRETADVRAKLYAVFSFAVLLESQIKLLYSLRDD